MKVYYLVVFLNYTAYDIFTVKYVWVLVTICLLLILIWFSHGNVIGGGDAGLAFFSPKITFNLSKTIWTEYGTGGSTIGWLPTAGSLYFYSIWEKFGVPTVILQASYFLIVLLTGTLSVYFLSQLFLREKNELIAFIAGLFYLFNPFTMSQVWARGQSAQQTAFALLPLSLLLFALGVKRKNYLFALLISLVSVIFATAFSYLTLVMVLWLVLLIYLLFNRSVFSIVFFLIAFISWLAVSAWWFLPLFTSSGSIYSVSISGSEENLGTLLGVSRNYPPDILIRLLQRTYFFDPNALSTAYSLLPFQLISLFAPLFLFIGLIKAVRRGWDMKLFIVLFVLGWAVSSGANPPTGWLFVPLFKQLSVLQAFRNPFEKFGLVLILGYSPIFAYGLVSFFAGNRYKNLAIATVIFLICGIFAWPMWTGRVVAGPDQKIGLSVPLYYKNLNKWLGENNRDERVLMTPIWNGDGAFYQWGESRYQGSDPMIYILNQQTISNGSYAPISYEFIPNIRKYIDRVNITPALSLLRVKYLVNRKDAIYITSFEKDHIKYLTDAMYTPQKESPDLAKICKNLSSKANGINPAWITCPIVDAENNWSKTRYLHIKIKTDQAAFLDIAITDENGVRVRWDGRFDQEYSTGEGMTLITIPLGNPTEYNFALDYSKVHSLEIQARSKNQPESSVNEINLEEISLDPGKEERIDNFRLIKTFGNLEVYEPIAFKLPPLFGSLTRVSLVSNFLQLFEQVNKQNDSVESLGFLVTSQNLGRDLQKLEGEGTLRVEDKYEASNTRFWLKTNQGPGFILLSKTFNTQWKLIPGVSRNQLSGNLFEDWDLLNKTSMGEENHFVVNGYANLWKVDGREEYAIIYKPQIIADIGAKISKYSLFLISGVLLLLLVKRYVKKY